MSNRLFLANDRNCIPGAALLASSVRAAVGTVLAGESDWSGSGQARLAGNYTGSSDALIEVEILDTDVTDEPLVSVPVKQGPGTSVLSGIDVAGLPAQEFALELVSAGQRPAAASLTVDGVRIVRKTTGTDGNNWSLSISRAGLTYTNSDYSLLDDLPAGTTEVQGAQYDWDAVIIGGDGRVPPTARRVAFGDDDAVYVTWKEYRAGQWYYRFEPVIERAVPAGTRVRFVTGGVSVSLTDGTDTETYTGIVTRYDLGTAIQSGSNRFRVTTVIADDRRPSGQALRDLRARTDAYAASNTGSGSQYATGFTGVTVGAVAATEQVRAVCFAVTREQAAGATVGSELFRLTGTVSGDLGILRTAQAYIHPAGRFGVTIPRKLPPNHDQPRGRYSHTRTTYASRSESAPPIKMTHLVLGASAVDKTLTLTYRIPVSTANCNPDDAPVLGRLQADCLGLNYVEGGMAFSPEYQARTEAIGLWKRDFSLANTEITGGIVRAAWLDLALADAAEQEFQEALDDVEDSATTADLAATWAEWTAQFNAMKNTDLAAIAAGLIGDGGHPVWVGGDYSVGDTFVPPMRNGHYYEVLQTFVTESNIGTDAFEPYWRQNGGTDYVATGLSTDGGIRYFTGYAVIDRGRISNADMTQQHAETPVYRYTIEAFRQRWRDAMNYVRRLAGIRPKSEASGAGSACWQAPADGEPYWEVNSGDYLPALTNRVYHSVMGVLEPGTEKVQVTDTREFAFRIACACPGSLRDGDTITLQIGDAGSGSTYQVGDTLTLSIIGGAPLALSGGLGGSGLQQWLLTGSVSGPLPAYALDPDDPEPYTYSSGGASLSLLLTPGGIDDGIGSRHLFSVEGGHFRYRIDGGSWSSPLAVSATPADIGAGLSLVWDMGAAPSFAAGDTAQWTVLQPYSPDQLRTPGQPAWEWTGSSATLTIDLGSAKAVSACGLAFADLPAGAAITLEAGNNGAVWPLSVPITRQSGPMVSLFEQVEYRYWRLSLTSATDGALGWLWLGTPLTTVYDPDWQAEYVYSMSRAGGINPAAQYLGDAVSGTVAWKASDYRAGGDQYHLTADEYAAVMAMVRGLKAAGDEHLIFVPHKSDPADAVLARVAIDRLPVSETYRNRLPADVRRYYGLELQLAGWVASA